MFYNFFYSNFVASEKTTYSLATLFLVYAKALCYYLKTKIAKISKNRVEQRNAPVVACTCEPNGLPMCIYDRRGAIMVHFPVGCLAIPRFRMNSDTVLTLSHFLDVLFQRVDGCPNISRNMGNSHKSEIFIGKLIQQKIDEKGFSYAEFARRINCSRTSLYYLFNSKSIDVERLLLISEVLQYDFISQVYAVEIASVKQDTPFLQLPFKDGDIDLSHLPKELLLILKERIEEKL